MKLKNIYHILFIIFLSACGPATLTVPTPTLVSSLPDLAITTMYVSMVDDSGRCLELYQLLMVLVNQSSVPANDVFLIETSTGHQVQVGGLGALQSMSLYIPATSPSGSYTVVVDPQNVVIESDENNNTAAFFDSRLRHLFPARRCNQGMPRPHLFHRQLRPAGFGRVDLCKHGLCSNF